MGNRLSKISDDVTEKYKYNVKNELIELYKNNDKTLFNYDNQGNTIKEETKQGNNIFKYNPLNQQVKAITREGNTLVSRYDAEGLRAEIEENQKLTKFIFHKDNVLVQTDKDYNVVSRFTRGYEVVAADIGESKNLKLRESNNLNRYYYAQDEQGSTTLITDNNENVKNEYQYDAFGNTLESKEEVFNRITYTGQQFDGITKQYYLRARYYNPVIGRFTQEDTYRGDGLNLYAYCRNNPVEYFDPSGFKGRVCPPSKENSWNDFQKGNTGKYHSQRDMADAYYKERGTNPSSHDRRNRYVNEGNSGKGVVTPNTIKNWKGQEVKIPDGHKMSPRDPSFSEPPIYRKGPFTTEQRHLFLRGKSAGTKLAPHHRNQIPVRDGGVIDELPGPGHPEGNIHTGGSPSRHPSKSIFNSEVNGNQLRKSEIYDAWNAKGQRLIEVEDGIWIDPGFK